MRYLALCLLLVSGCCSEAWASDVRFPMRGVTVTPQSTPVMVAEVVDTIRPEEWYIVESEAELICLVSPVGIVQIEPLTGPMAFRGRFAGGDGSIETRQFAGPHLYAVTSVKPGKAELLVIPVSVSSGDQIIRQVLTVSGQGPQPPPTPDDDDTDPEPGPVQSFRVIFVKESGQTLNIAQSAIPAARVIRDYLTAKTTHEGGLPGFREYDPDQILQNEEPTLKALWSAVKPNLLPAPCMVVEVNSHATVMAFPANVDECMKILRKHAGDEQ